MKIDRLIGIITVLINNDKVTAPALAEKFEVSRRTINRDIEDICKAGIPIVSTQGYDGGISIADGYKIDKALFKKDELQTILAGLKSLESISQDKSIENIKEKFFMAKNNMIYEENILIDLSSHYKNSIKSKINLLKEALSESRLVKFTYYYNKGEKEKIVEPYFIVFQWEAWYLFSYSIEKNDYRMFKLNRMSSIEILKQSFEKRNVPQEKLEFNNSFPDEIILKAVFNESVKYRLIDEYGINCFSYTKDNKLLFESGFTNKDYLLNWILSFGDNVHVIEPQYLKEQLKQHAENILKMYE